MHSWSQHPFRQSSKSLYIQITQIFLEMSMFKTMQWSTFHFLQIPLSIIYLLFIILWAIKDNFHYRDYIVPFSCILLPCLWFFLIKRGLKLRRLERAE